MKHNIRINLINPETKFKHIKFSNRISKVSPKKEVYLSGLKEQIKKTKEKNFQGKEDIIRYIEKTGFDNVHIVKNQNELGELLVEILEKNRVVLVNKSFSIYAIGDLLDLKGFQVFETYYKNFDTKKINYWDLHEINPEVLLDSFRIMGVDVKDESIKKKATGLLGVSAFSLEGDIFLIEHSFNISEIIKTCETLIFIVPINKVFRTNEDVLPVIKALINSGYYSILYDLGAQKLCEKANKNDRTISIEELENAGYAQEIHVIIIDENKPLEFFNCIGCRYCTIHCPSYNYFTYIGDKVANVLEFSFLKIKNIFTVPNSPTVILYVPVRRASCRERGCRHVYMIVGAACMER